ncbi:MAG: O-antigen ligase family protein [Patescibacteria group bacterium]
MMLLLRRLVGMIPQILVYLLFFFVPLQTVYLLMTPMIGKPEGIWQYGVIGLYGTDILALFLVIYAIVIRVGKRHSLNSAQNVFERIPLKLLVCGWVIVCGWSLIALTWAPAGWASLYAIVRIIEVGLIVWAMRQLTWPWVGACSALVSMAALQGMLAWHQYLNQHIGANKWLGLAYHSSRELGDSVVENVLRRFLRAYGTFAHPNMLGIYLAIALVICFALVWCVKKKWQGYLLLIAWMSIVSGLILTFSRAGWIAALVGSLGFLVTKLMMRKHVRIFSEHHQGFGMLMVVSSIIVIGALGYGLWEPVSTRLGIGGLQRLETMSLQERGTSISEGVNIAQSSLPFGVGLGQYTYTVYLKDKTQHHEKPSYSYQPTHAVPLLIVSELGVAGIVGLICIVVGLVWLVMVRIKTIVSEFDAVRVSLSVSLLLVLIVAMMSDHFLWTTHVGTILVATVMTLFLAVPSRPAAVYALSSPTIFSK